MPTEEVVRMRADERSAAGGAHSPRKELERRVAEGRIAQSAVDLAYAVWDEQLRRGVVMSNGETVFVSEDDLDHVLLVDRIRRKPERVRRLLENVFELRSTHSGRRLGLCQWKENGETLYGFAIIDASGHLRTAQVVDARTVRKKARQGTLLWRRDE